MLSEDSGLKMLSVPTFAMPPAVFHFGSTLESRTFRVAETTLGIVLEPIRVFDQLPADAAFAFVTFPSEPSEGETQAGQPTAAEDARGSEVPAHEEALSATSRALLQRGIEDVRAGRVRLMTDADFGDPETESQ